MTPPRKMNARAPLGGPRSPRAERELRLITVILELTEDVHENSATPCAN